MGDGTLYICELKAAKGINCVLSIESWLSQGPLHYSSNPKLQYS